LLFFVFGTGRCGSSLVTEVLARHPEVGFVSNVDDKLSWLDLGGRWNNALYRRCGPRDPAMVTFRHRRRLLERGRMRVAPSEGWNVLDRQVSPVVSGTCRDLGADDVTPWLERRLREFFERRMTAQHRRHFLHHLTGWPRAGMLQAVFPEARFIHVIRDGRAVASSWLQMPWWSGHRGPSHWSLGELPERYALEWEHSGRSYVVLAGLAWKLLMDAFDAARLALPPQQWLDVRYEDVLAEPRKQVERMLEFVGLDWTRRFDAGFRRYRFEHGRSAAFRRDLDPANLALLERSLAGRLLAYDYPLTPQGGFR
jgi:Sulfotransferase family